MDRPEGDPTIGEKLANLAAHAELWCPEDMSYADFAEVYVEVARKLYEEKE